MHRRTALGLLAASALPAAEPDPIFEPHVHLFSADLTKYPKHPNGSALVPAPLEGYIPFAKAAGIRHAIHVSAEPYQDDTRYLEYTLQNAPAGFLKGTVLLDTLRPDTPSRLEALARKYPKQLLGMRIHCVRPLSQAPATTGMLRDRDLMHPQAKAVWKKSADLGLWIKAHIMPWHAPQIGQLAREFPGAKVLLDHLGHAGVLGKATYGYTDPKEFRQITDLAKIPNVSMMVSGLQYSSRLPAPHADLAPLLRQAVEAFGPDRLVWGSLGTTKQSLASAQAIWDAHFGFLKPGDRRKLRFETGKRLFGF